MNLPNVKDVEALVKMLRKHGVTDFKANGLELRIEPADEKAKNGTASDKLISEDVVDEEALLFWSANGGN